MKLSYRIDSR